ncbi:unnamed protein product [Phaedon cochleariae]|uniref:U5 small nuclear ribonucleoprotein TSSC4 n=1 Tax=Phaedon cochleariae TaxID=80249 RepID=A0A9P0DM57_PHACE|nr:unnamed protein product [Phaedon cochleariae]
MSTTFTLKSTNADFSQRQKDVFEQLKVLENNRKNSTFSTAENGMETDEIPDGNKHQRRFTKQYRGKESIFKKPQNLAPKNYMRGIPDFKKNPHKWTKYSLDDVKDEDISDKTNTKAALSFLKELRDRRSTEIGENNERSMPDSQQKIIFQRHAKIEKKGTESDPEDLKSTFRSSKVVMPEYVVGQKVKKDRKPKSKTGSRGKELKLVHLFDEAEDE